MLWTLAEYESWRSYNRAGSQELDKSNSPTEVHFDISYFYYIFTTCMTSICDKKSKQMSLKNVIILWRFLCQWESMGFFKQIPHGNLSCLAGMKLEFFLESWKFYPSKMGSCNQHLTHQFENIRSSTFQ